MNNTPFIGIGTNPEGIDLPLGLGMRLAQEPGAIDTFGSLDEQQKSGVVRYIQDSVTGDDAKERIEKAVTALKDGNTSFFIAT